MKKNTFAQKQRLHFIHVCLKNFGVVTRQSIADMFDASLPTATRDLKLYNEMFPANSILNNVSKGWERASTFTDEFEV